MGFSIGKALKGAVKGIVTTGSPWGAISGAAGGFLDAYNDKQELKYQQKQNIKLWNMQNEYNSPKAQMQRYIDAGLNPNLIYSQQNTAGDIAGSTLGSNDTIGQANSLLNSKANRLQTYQQLLNMQSSREQVEAQTEAIHNQIKNSNALLPYQIEMMKAQANSIGIQNQAPWWLQKLFGNNTASHMWNYVDKPQVPAKPNPERKWFIWK